MPSVFREFAAFCKLTGRPISSTAPRVGIASPALNVMESNRCPSNEDVGHKVSAASHKRNVVAAGAGVRVGRGYAVQVPREDERGGRIGQRISGSFAEWPPAALLNGPVGDEELSAELDQIWDADLELFVILEVPLDGDLAPEAGRSAILCAKYTPKQQE